MTDIDKLKDDVIEVARAFFETQTISRSQALEEALTALDEAQKPDPWGILERLVRIGERECLPTDQAMAVAHAALAWRKENPDG